MTSLLLKTFFSSNEHSIPVLQGQVLGCVSVVVWAPGWKPRQRGPAGRSPAGDDTTPGGRPERREAPRGKSPWRRRRTRPGPRRRKGRAGAYGGGGRRPASLRARRRRAA